MDYFLDTLWPDPEGVCDRGLASWFADYAQEKANHYAGLDHKTKARLWSLAHRYTAQAVYLATGVDSRERPAA